MTSRWVASAVEREPRSARCAVPARRTSRPCEGLIAGSPPVERRGDRCRRVGRRWLRRARTRSRRRRRSAATTRASSSCSRRRCRASTPSSRRPTTGWNVRDLGKPQRHVRRRHARPGPRHAAAARGAQGRRRRDVVPRRGRARAGRGAVDGDRQHRAAASCASSPRTVAPSCASSAASDPHDRRLAARARGRNRDVDGARACRRSSSSCCARCARARIEEATRRRPCAAASRPSSSRAICRSSRSTRTRRTCARSCGGCAARSTRSAPTASSRSCRVAATTSRCPSRVGG